MNFDKFIVPQVSKDIEISAFDGGDYLIKNKRLNYQLKINAATREMLTHVDGIRTIEDIAQILSHKLENSLDASHVFNVLYNGKLVDCGVVETNRKIQPKKPDEYIWIRVILFSSRRIEWICSLLAPLFRPSIFYIITFVSLSYLIGVLFFFNDLHSIFNKFIEPENIMLFYSLTLASMLLHELGHASSCHYFGARHGGIGWGLYIIFPVFFADVSDAWSLSRRQRFIVDMAGIYMELLLYVAISIVYFATKNTFYLQLVFLRLIGTTVNLNPLLRFDAYWALSDLINVPNLQTNSTKKITALMKWMIAIKHPFPLKSRTEYFLAVYAFLSWGLLVIFLATTLYVSFNSIIYLPLNIYQLGSKLLNGQIKMDGSVLKAIVTDFSLPLLFYFILSRWAYRAVQQFRARMAIRENSSTQSGSSVVKAAENL